jgi:hypothetical protein
MTLRELEHAERAMQQQWHDLVMAEQQGETLDALEQMYDNYILRAEEYNRCHSLYEEQQRRQSQRQTAQHGHNRNNRSRGKDQQDIRLAS